MEKKCPCPKWGWYVAPECPFPSEILVIEHGPHFRIGDPPPDKPLEIVDAGKVGGHNPTGCCNVPTELTIVPTPGHVGLWYKPYKDEPLKIRKEGPPGEVKFVSENKIGIGDQLPGQLHITKSAQEMGVHGIGTPPLAKVPMSEDG